MTTGNDHPNITEKRIKQSSLDIMYVGNTHYIEVLLVIQLPYQFHIHLAPGYV